MSLNPYNKIVLKSTTKMSLNDRFSAYRKNAESAAAAAAAASSSVSAVRQRVQHVQQQNSKNWRLIQQMENRPSVIAALKIKKRSLKQRLGQPPRTSVKARLSLGSSAGIVFSPGGQRYTGRGRGGRGRGNYLVNAAGGRVRRGGVGGLVIRGRGARSQFVPATRGNAHLQSRLDNLSLGWQTVQRRPFRSAVRGRGIRGGRISWNQNWQQGTNQQIRGGYRGGNRGGAIRGQYRRQYNTFQQDGGLRGQRRGVRGRGGGGAGRGGTGNQQQNPVVTKQTLDSELDEYMSRTKGNLDMELESYMAQMHAE